MPGFPSPGRDLVAHARSSGFDGVVCQLANAASMARGDSRPSLASIDPASKASQDFPMSVPPTAQNRTMRLPGRNRLVVAGVLCLLWSAPVALQGECFAQQRDPYGRGGQQGGSQGQGGGNDDVLNQLRSLLEGRGSRATPTTGNRFGFGGVDNGGFPGASGFNPPLLGFPTFPSGLSTSAYPAPSLIAGPPIYDAGSEAALRPKIPRRNDWPSWILDQMEGETNSFLPERAVLVSSSYRVWYRPPEELAYVPLSYWDKVRVVRDGSEIQVRTTGAFQVAFQDSSSLEASGPVELRVAELSPSVIRLDLTSFDLLRVVSRARPARLNLPDGSVLATPGAEGADSSFHVDMQLQRLDEQSGQIHNRGPGTAVLSSAFGDVKIGPGERVRFFLERIPENPIGSRLVTSQNLVVRRDGESLEAQGDGTGQVTWMGARFRFSGGSRLRLDPLLGSSFWAGEDRRP